MFVDVQPDQFISLRCVVSYSYGFSWFFYGFLFPGFLTIINSWGGSISLELFGLLTATILGADIMVQCGTGSSASQALLDIGQIICARSFSQYAWFKAAKACNVEEFAIFHSDQFRDNISFRIFPLLGSSSHWLRIELILPSKL